MERELSVRRCRPTEDEFWSVGDVFQVVARTGSASEVIAETRYPVEANILAAAYRMVGALEGFVSNWGEYEVMESLHLARKILAEIDDVSRIPDSPPEAPRITTRKRRSRC